MHRDEWIEARVFEHLVDVAIPACDEVGLDPTEVAIDASLHRASVEVMEPVPTRPRERPGRRGSIATEISGIPIGCAVEAADRHDRIHLSPRLAAVRAWGFELDLDIETVHPDRGSDASLRP